MFHSPNEPARLTHLPEDSWFEGLVSTAFPQNVLYCTPLPYNIFEVPHPWPRKRLPLIRPLVRNLNALELMWLLHFMRSIVRSTKLHIQAHYWIPEIEVAWPILSPPHEAIPWVLWLNYLHCLLTHPQTPSTILALTYAWSPPRNPQGLGPWTQGMVDNQYYIRWSLFAHLISLPVALGWLRICLSGISINITIGWDKE